MIDRRTFFALFATPRVTILEALAAPKLPHTRVIPHIASNAPIFEFRTYAKTPPVDLLRKSGVDPIRKSGSTYLFAFDSLEARQSAWTAAASDPRWTGLHASEISVYRRLS